MNPHPSPEKDAGLWHWVSYLLLLIASLEAVFGLIGGLPVSWLTQAMLDTQGRPIALVLYPFVFHWHGVALTFPSLLWVALLLDALHWLLGHIRTSAAWQASHCYWRMRTVLWFAALHLLLHATLAVLQWQAVWQTEAQFWQLWNWANSVLYAWLLLRLLWGLVRLDGQKAMPLGWRHSLSLLGLWYGLTGGVLILAAAGSIAALLWCYRTQELAVFLDWWLQGWMWLLALTVFVGSFDLLLARTQTQWHAHLRKRARSLGGFIALHAVLLCLPWFMGEAILWHPTGLLTAIGLQCLLCLWLARCIGLAMWNAGPARARHRSEGKRQSTEAVLVPFASYASYFLLLLVAGAALLRFVCSLAGVQLPVFGLFYTAHTLLPFKPLSTFNPTPSLLRVIVLSIPPLLIVALALDLWARKAPTQTSQAWHDRWRIRTMLWFLLLHTAQQIIYAPLLNTLMWHGGIHLLWLFSCFNASIYLWLLYRCIKGMRYLHVGWQKPVITISPSFA